MDSAKPVALIAGVIRFAPGSIDPTFINKLVHCGPDDLGWLNWDGARIRKGDVASQDLSGKLLFWHQRLSIIDLPRCGWQPMSSVGGRFHLVFNGEIYNYLELRAELEALGDGGDEILAGYRGLCSELGSPP